MPDVRIYRVSVTGNNQSHVQWTDCSGYTPPAQLINSRLKSIGFEARVGTVTTSAPATLEIVGDGNPDCSGTGNSENLTTTTTAAPTTTTTTTTTTTAAPNPITLGSTSSFSENHNGTGYGSLDPYSINISSAGYFNSTSTTLLIMETGTIYWDCSIINPNSYTYSLSIHVTEGSPFYMDIGTGSHGVTAGQIITIDFTIDQFLSPTASFQGSFYIA
jgi:hypothetical protein